MAESFVMTEGGCLGISLWDGHQSMPGWPSYVSLCFLGVILEGEAGPTLQPEKALLEVRLSETMQNNQSQLH
jgi:hypothetical protein